MNNAFYTFVGYFLGSMLFAGWWGVMVVFTFTVWDKAYHKHIEEEQNKEIHQGWTPRSIPMCEKELWLRITEGCDVEQDD